MCKFILGHRDGSAQDIKEQNENEEDDENIKPFVFAKIFSSIWIIVYVSVGGESCFSLCLFVYYLHRKKKQQKKMT